MAKGGKPDDTGTEEISPFALKAMFPDAQGIFTAQHGTLASVKDDCFVALDANVLLLPYKSEGQSLPDIMNAYRPLADAGRLVIPAQAAREFAKHRSKKVAEMAKFLRDQSSFGGPQLSKKIGALEGFASYQEAKKKVRDLSVPLKEAQQAIKAVADEIVANIGEDPVSVAYRDVLTSAVVDDPENCRDATAFTDEMRSRYAIKRPPGYKDNGKPDEGAGDLIIWKTLLAEGAKRKQHCIFVTGDQKPDWYVQTDGPFQPRFELIEEYRSECGKAIHIIPLSTFLHLYNASPETVQDVERVEASALRLTSSSVVLSESDRVSAEIQRLISERHTVVSRKAQAARMLGSVKNSSPEELNEDDIQVIRNSELRIDRLNKRIAAIERRISYLVSGMGNSDEMS